jgi:spermidine synthase
MTWFAETLYAGFRQTHKISKKLFSGRSPFQRIEIFESERFGRVLALDGVVQTTEKDEFVYHEMMTHLPILAHGRARSVLIVGGGDGGMLEEVLKHKSIERVTMVEIDGLVIDVCRRHLKSINGKAFSDPRTHLVVGDGAAWVRDTNERYDVVMVDRPDPVGPAEILFSKKFYSDCKRVMTPRGILVAQNGVPIMQGSELTDALRLFRRIFRHQGCYVISVPTYVLGLMTITWASDADITKISPSGLMRRFAQSNLKRLKYYNPAVHAAAFALPGYVRALLP